MPLLGGSRDSFMHSYALILLRIAVCTIYYPFVPLSCPSFTLEKLSLVRYS